MYFYVWMWKSVKPTEWQWKLKRFLSCCYCWCHRRSCICFGRVMSIMSARARTTQYMSMIQRMCRFRAMTVKSVLSWEADVINNSAFDSINSLRQFVSWYFLWPPSTIEPYFFSSIYHCCRWCCLSSVIQVFKPFQLRHSHTELMCIEHWILYTFMIKCPLWCPEVLNSMRWTTHTQ